MAQTCTQSVPPVTEPLETQDTVIGAWQGPDSEAWQSCEVACSLLDEKEKGFVILDFATVNEGDEYVPVGRLALAGPGVRSLGRGLLEQDPAGEIVSGDGVLTVSLIALRLPEGGGRE